ncbi:LysR family transcriptional regulator [Motilimonas sp. KMU-193]|uniref:helix-turn-helix domain-containing protein n=1 Tax=Motilimonas sp. KMU-193 TaxID=3388668 RepID=UPI00396B22E3
MRLEDMQLFVQVVETGSFTQAAQLADIPKSTVSRCVRSLEESLSRLTSVAKPVMAS